MRFMSLFIYPTVVPLYAPCHCEDGFLWAYRACFMRIVTLSGTVHTLIYDFLCGLFSVVSKCECFQSKNISALLYVITIFAMSIKV